jgi:hypothetical protein
VTSLFPWMLVGLNLCASYGYAWDGDLKRSIYWLAAAVLTTCVTL